MNKEERLKAAEEHARKVCGEYYDLMYENEPAIEYSMGQLCTDDFMAGAEAEAESKWNTKAIEENNGEVYCENTDEIERCCEDGLASDGGEYWINGHKIIDALTANGYVIKKVETTP